MKPTDVWSGAFWRPSDEHHILAFVKWHQTRIVTITLGRDDWTSERHFIPVIDFDDEAAEMKMWMTGSGVSHSLFDYAREYPAQPYLDIQVHREGRGPRTRISIYPMVYSRADTRRRHRRRRLISEPEMDVARPERRIVLSEEDRQS